MAAQPQRKTATQRREQMLCELLAREGSVLRRQARAHAQRPSDAEDALQDACVQFLRYYDGPREEAILWMQVVVKRCAWAIARRASRVRETGLVPGGNGDRQEPATVAVEGGSDPAEWAERRQAVAERFELLDELKPDERTALLLFASGHSYKEIASRQNWTLTKVNRCLAEGRAALRARHAEGS